MVWSTKNLHLIQYFCWFIQQHCLTVFLRCPLSTSSLYSSLLQGLAEALWSGYNGHNPSAFLNISLIAIYLVIHSSMNNPQSWFVKIPSRQQTLSYLCNLDLPLESYWSENWQDNDMQQSQFMFLPFQIRFNPIIPAFVNTNLTSGLDPIWLTIIQRYLNYFNILTYIHIKEEHFLVE